MKLRVVAIPCALDVGEASLQLSVVLEVGLAPCEVELTGADVEDCVELVGELEEVALA